MPAAKFQVVFLNGAGQCSFPAQFPLVTPAYFMRPPPHDGFQPPSQASQHFSMESIQLDFQVDDSRQAANPHTRDGPPVRGYAYRLSLDLWMVILSIQDFSIFPSHSSWHELESQSVDQWCQYLVSSFEADRAQALEHEANAANDTNRDASSPPSPWRKITVLDPLPDLAIRFSTMYAYSQGQTKSPSAESTAANSPTKSSNGDDASVAGIKAPVHLQPQLAGPIQAPLRDMRAASSVTDPVRAFGFVPSVHWDESVPMMASPLHPRYDAVVAFADCFLLVEWAPLDHLRRASMARQSSHMSKHASSPKKEFAGDGSQRAGSYLDRSSSSGAEQGDGADPASPTRYGAAAANPGYDMWGNSAAGWYPQAQPGYVPRGGYYSAYPGNQPVPGGNGADMFMGQNMYQAAAMASQQQQQASTSQQEPAPAPPKKASNRSNRRVTRGDRRCTVCLTTESRLWRRGGENNQDYLCNACGLREGRQKRKFAILDALIKQDQDTRAAPQPAPPTHQASTATAHPITSASGAAARAIAGSLDHAAGGAGSSSDSRLAQGGGVPGGDILATGGAKAVGAALGSPHPMFPNEQLAAAEASRHQSPVDHQH